MMRVCAIHLYTIAAATIIVAAIGGLALAAQDKYTLQVTDGLAFSDFRGYEDWQVVSVAKTDDVLNAVVANPAMIAAFSAGVPGNGRSFPDGAKIAKIQWIPKKSTEAPFSVDIPDVLKDVAFMTKDSQRFPDSGGWGYALFNYDNASEAFTPEGNGAKCGFACHTAVKAKDYIFHPYQKR